MVKDLEEAYSILMPQTPDKLRTLVRMSFTKPAKITPSYLFADFINPILIVWGEKDKVFPLELGNRLKRHIGENSELVIIKNAGHALNLEKPKEFYKHLKTFVIDSQSLPSHPVTNGS